MRKMENRSAFSLVELLVVITIIGLLAALLFPALNSARSASRQAVCAANLRQFGIGMTAHAERHHAFCSGAFSWKYDGCVTEVGWVADLVAQGTPVGQMLCPSNPARISATYNDLLNMVAPASYKCVDRLGSAASTNPDGSTVMNPCREIIENSLAPGGADRRNLVENKIYLEHFNTNYTASWWLVRSGFLLDKNGNLKSNKDGCAPSRLAVYSSLGPLTPGRADTASISSCFIPLLACGGASSPLSMQIGDIEAGELTAAVMTPGPATNPGMELPKFADDTAQGGPDGWWATWNNTRQDFRCFAPVHRGACNILFADGSVRAVVDENGDGVLNNGFLPTAANGFSSDEIELPDEEALSKWQLR